MKNEKYIKLKKKLELKGIAFNQSKENENLFIGEDGFGGNYYILLDKKYGGVSYSKDNKKFNAKYSYDGKLKNVEFNPRYNQNKRLNIVVEPEFKLLKKNKLESFVHGDYSEAVNQKPEKEISLSGNGFSIYDFFEGKPILKDSGLELKYDTDKIPLKLEEIEI